MIFPGSRLWHEGVASDLAHLTDEMRYAGFTGHIVLEFQDSLDLVIVSKGDFLKVVEKIGRRIMTTKKYREIWGKCQIKPGRMFVFELPPPLAARLRGLCRRKPLCSGDIDACDFDRIIGEQRSSGFSGFLEGASREGKGILEMQKGEINTCFYTEHHGLAFRGFDAFVRWHGNLHRQGRTFSLFLSEHDAGSDHSQSWDSVLTEGMDDVRLPLRSVDDRLFAAFGQTAFEGERLFEEGKHLDRAFFLIEGEVELERRSAGRSRAMGRLGAGTVLGLSWLNGRTPPSMTGRAVTDCRFLTFDRSQLDHILFNSPKLAAALIAKSAGQLLGVRRRRDLFDSNPRLRDLETYVLKVLNADPLRLREGMAPGELFRELTQLAPFSLPEMDQMVRGLVGAGRFEMSGGRISLQPEEI